MEAILPEPSFNNRKRFSRNFLGVSPCLGLPRSRICPNKVFLLCCFLCLLLVLKTNLFFSCSPGWSRWDWSDEMLVPMSMPTSAQIVRFPLYLPGSLSPHPKLDIYNKSPEQSLPALFSPACTKQLPGMLMSALWMSKPAVVDPRAGSVQTAEGAGVFFLSTHLQGCQIVVTSDGLAVILSADNVEARQVQWERRCRAGVIRMLSPWEVTSLPRSLNLPNKHELRLSYCKSIFIIFF